MNKWVLALNMIKFVLTDLNVAQALVDPSLVLPMRGVEVILDAIVATTGKFFGDVGPLISKLFMLVKNLLLLTLVDWRLIDVWVQVIVPSMRARIFKG